MDAMVTVQKEGASEAGAVVALNAADTTAVEEVDLLVWGKLQSATAPKVFSYIAKCNPFLNTPTLI